MGTRIQLHSLCNDERGMSSGLCGTVVGVDDQPSLLMKWDNGRGLSLMPFEDSFTVIQEQQPGFVAKLVGCFADGQTDEQLIAEVNAVFGTDLDPEDFSAIMNYANHQLVEVAKAQLGNVGGEPYWSWYGFPSRVECVRPTLDFVQVAEFVGVRFAKPRKLFDSHCDF